jgi:hypothetical protein
MLKSLSTPGEDKLAKLLELPQTAEGRMQNGTVALENKVKNAFV